MIAYRFLVSHVATHLGLPPLPEKWSGLDVCLPLLERMRSEGAVVLIKLDGVRMDNYYTCVVSGGSLKGEYYRTDAESIEDCLSYIIVNYARDQWGFSESQFG